MSLVLSWFHRRQLFGTVYDRVLVQADDAMGRGARRCGRRGRLARLWSC